MSLIDVLIPLIPGIFLVAFPQIVTPRNATKEEKSKKKTKFRKMGYVLIGVATLYFVIMLAQPR